MKKTLILLAFILPIYANSQVKISEMPAATTVNDADNFILVQSGTTKKVAYSVFKWYSDDVGDQINDSLVILRTNTIWGDNANANGSGLNKVIIGNLAGTNNTEDYLIAIGDRAFNNTTSTSLDYSVAIGRSAGSSASGLRSFFGGYNTGASNSGNYVTAIGSFSAQNNTRSNFVGIGYYNGYNNTGDKFSGLGTYSGYKNEGDNNTFLGYYSGYYTSLDGIEGDNNTFIGYNTTFSDSTIINSAAIGANSIVTTDSTIVLGDSTDTKITRNLIVAGNITGNISAAGNDTEIQFNNNGITSASSNFTWNDTTLKINSLGSNINIGYGAGNSMISGASYNILIGYDAGKLITNSVSNTMIGGLAGESNTTGYGNVFIGGSSGQDNIGGNDNVFIGFGAGDGHTGGYENTFLGKYAGGNNLTGHNNIFLGSAAGRNETGSNKLYIDNSNTASPLIYGDFAEDSLRFNGIVSVKEKIVLDSTEQTYTEGAIFYDKDLKAMTAYNDLSDFSHQLGYEHVARYYNNTGSTIDNGTLLTPVGQKINGSIIPTVQIAGNGVVDSLKMVAMSTTNTLDGEFGVVTLLGPVNGLDLSAFSDNDFMYVGHNGEFTNVSPSPPEYSLLIGKVFYADNDSGQLYMMPGNIDFTPSPHVGADTSRASFAITINTQNVFEYIPIGSADIQDNHGFTVTGDSIQPQVAGSYTIVLSMSFQGNPTAETWRYGMFINNIEEYTKSRSTSSSDNGDVNVPATRFLDTTDWVSFRITNESGTGNPTVIDLGYEFIFLHE